MYVIGVTQWLLFQWKFTLLNPVQWLTHHRVQRAARCQQAAWEASIVRRISKRKHAAAARAIINKTASCQLLGCECPADAVSEISTMPWSDRFLLSNNSHTGLQSSSCSWHWQLCVPYIQPLKICCREHSSLALQAQMHSRRRHSGTSLWSICLFGRASGIVG